MAYVCNIIQLTNLFSLSLSLSPSPPIHSCEHQADLLPTQLIPIPNLIMMLPAADDENNLQLQSNSQHTQLLLEQYM